MKPAARALSIAGSDPSGGAGVQADLKTFQRFGVYGQTAIALLTVQNTLGVTRVDNLAPELVRAQAEAALADIGADAVKTGALGSAATIATISEVLATHPKVPLVVDPVLASKNGKALLDADALDALKRLLIPRALLIMPNVPEAEALLGAPLNGDFANAVKELHRLGAHSVLLKGGHSGDSEESNDLYYDGEELAWLNSQRIITLQTHGTGCTYSAAVTALVAKGLPLLQAVRRAKAYVTRAIAEAPGLGKGHGPVNHWAGSPLLTDC